MADKQIVDARGLSCPQPVLMTKKALEASPSAKCFEIIVDNGTAKEKDGNIDLHRNLFHPLCCGEFLPSSQGHREKTDADACSAQAQLLLRNLREIPSGGGHRAVRSVGHF